MAPDAGSKQEQEAAQLEVLQGQVEELEAVAACYDNDLIMAPVELDNLRFAAAVIESSSGGGAAASAADVPALSGTLRLPGVSLAGHSVQLTFVLPKQGGVPRLQVHTNAGRQEADLLQQLADTAAAECAADGTPCLLVVADQVAQAARDLDAAASDRQHAGQQPPATAAGADGTGSCSGGGGGGEHVLSRRCLVFHHIKNLNKRKSIVQWGGDLRLGGWSKPGFPGVVLVEGERSDVADYISRLRALRWQSMAVRAEEDLPFATQQDLEAARTAPRGVQELGEDDMGRLAAAARQAGVEHLFRVALGLGPAAS